MQNKEINPELMKRAKDLAGFYMHLFWYTVVNIGLNLTDFVSDGKLNWAYWTTLGWGIGIFVHSTSIFAGKNLVQMIYDKLEKNK